MDSEAIKANEKRLFGYVNERDVEAIKKWINEFVDENFTNHSPMFDVAPDKKGLKEMFQKFFQLFPDIKLTIEEMVFENDILCFRYIIQGTGAIEDIICIAMVRFKDGMIMDRWAATDAR